MVTSSFCRSPVAPNIPTMIYFMRLLLIDHYVLGTCFTIAEAVRIISCRVGGKNIAYESPYWEEGERFGTATRNRTD